jgi:hypothetical protein
MHTIATDRGWRRQAILLAALTVFVRMLVPSGWMPAADRIGLMPCFGVAPRSASVPATAHAPSHHRKDHAPGNAGEKPCAFAGLACPLTSTDIPAAAMAPPPPVASLPAVQDITVQIGTGLAAPPPPPTGPPATA